MKIAIIGNCQARPLAQLIGIMTPEVEIVTVAIAQLLKDAQEPEYMSKFDECDYIFAQKITDTYECKFIRTKLLKERYKDKIVTWINMYYTGYNPELVSIRSASRLPLRGPLGDYHSETIIKGYRQGLSPAKCVERMFDPEYNREKFAGVPGLSLSELALRESDTDIRIAKFIAEYQGKERLFFTFNHPTSRLLIETSRQLLEQIGLSLKRDIDPEHTSDTLNTMIPPVNPFSVKDIGIGFRCGRAFKGQEVEVSELGNVEYGRSCIYSPDEIVAKFYSVYDSNPNEILSYQAR
jgi:hypothetical protein